MEDSTIAHTTAILQTLALSSIDLPLTNVYGNKGIRLPGADTAEKLALERELAALVSRVQRLEARAITVNNQTLPDTPNEL
nr:truncated two-component osmosensing histidine-kinase [Botrytis cinerea]AFQ90119.1 truncated two-component osmosensing histidine-kinase [Botrytis cinerea]AFQ90120.1 truncated two-component osmosensing histidine-kinase [Botrytis cinerea]